MQKLHARDYRRIAAENCKPFSANLALIYLIYILIFGALNVGFSFIGKIEVSPATYDSAGNVVTAAVTFSVGSSIINLASFIVVGAFLLSFINVIKDVFAKKNPGLERLFSGFSMFGQGFLLNLVRTIFLFLWSLLLIVPGIIKNYAYAMAFYILSDDPSIPVTDALKKSNEMMKGHKWELFCLEISYIGWEILCGLTLGILSLWVAPKIDAAHYAFYLHITGKDGDAVPVENTPSDPTPVKEDPVEPAPSEAAPVEEPAPETSPAPEPAAD